MAKPKTCTACKAKFSPFRTLQKVCSITCAMKEANRKTMKTHEKSLKEERRKLREQKEALKPLGKWRAEAQSEFNKFIRLRDLNEPCISCGRFHKGQYHAGHYRTRGANPELAFEELNCHKQCAPCNNHLSGNLVNYRINLIEKIGLEKVEWLEGPHDAKKYSIEDFKNIKITYRGKARDLERKAA